MEGPNINLLDNKRSFSLRADVEEMKQHLIDKVKHDYPMTVYWEDKTERRLYISTNDNYVLLVDLTLEIVEAKARNFVNTGSYEDMIRQDQREIINNPNVQELILFLNN